MEEANLFGNIQKRPALRPAVSTFKKEPVRPAGPGLPSSRGKSERDLTSFVLYNATPSIMTL